MFMNYEWFRLEWFSDHCVVIQRCFDQSYIYLVQWNLDLRKILGVDKIFLKSRFILISKTGKPLKVINKA